SRATATRSTRATRARTSTSTTCTSWSESSTGSTGARSRRAPRRPRRPPLPVPGGAMAEGKVKASKVKVHEPPEGTDGLDGRYHVYVFEVSNGTCLPGKGFDSVERAVSFQRHEQERIYFEQEADPELFDLPFLSLDPDLVSRVERDPAYKQRLVRDLTG